MRHKISLSLIRPTLVKSSKEEKHSLKEKTTEVYLGTACPHNSKNKLNNLLAIVACV